MSLTSFQTDRTALKNEVLAWLNVESRHVEQLCQLYAAASTAFDAWGPPPDWEGEWEEDIWTRESERAFLTMEALANRLAEVWRDADYLEDRVLATLTDWWDACDDNPAVILAIGGLTERQIHHARQLTEQREARQCEPQTV